MSASPITNVLRYSALGLGVVYGFSHQRSITKSEKAAEAKREYEHKASLIAQAKAQYNQLKNPSPAAAASGLNQDPLAPNFDLEAFCNALIKQ